MTFGQDELVVDRVLMPAEATTGRRTRSVVCVSRFGSLAVICAENPGAFFGTRDALAEGALDSADLAKVHKALTELGYTVVPEELLESDYDGPRAFLLDHGVAQGKMPATSSAAW
jgi:hypothetical protein